MGTLMSLRRKILRLGPLLLMMVSLSACQTHQLVKAGASPEQKEADSNNCFAEAREAAAGKNPAVRPTNQDAAIVAAPINGFAEGKAMGKYHNECMAKLGYERVPLN
jgi:hypothetical protein